jgi:predicted dienelactone hydrolase
VKAIVPIAPASGLLSDEELASIRIPMLLLSGTSDTTTPIVPSTTRPWDLVSSRVKYRVDVERAGHASFTDICDLAEILSSVLPPALLAVVLSNAAEACVPELRPVEQVQDLTNLYTVAFLERTLNGDGRYQRYLTPGFARSNDLPVAFDRRNGS